MSGVNYCWIDHCWIGLVCTVDRVETQITFTNVELLLEKELGHMVTFLVLILGIITETNNFIYSFMCELARNISGHRVALCSMVRVCTPSLLICLMLIHEYAGYRTYTISI